MDLLDDESRARLISEIDERPSGLDVLVHSAGTIARADVADATIEDFDLQFQANVRMPFALTKGLLRSLERAHGQVVFVSSSAGSFREPTRGSMRRLRPASAPWRPPSARRRTPPGTCW